MDRVRNIDPGEKAFLSLAEAAFESIPLSLRRYVGEVAFHIADFADAEVMEDMDIDDPYEILGLYRGVSLDQKEAGGTPADVDRIFLYLEPILDYCRASGETPQHVVRHVLIHEIGHHFGLSDEDMERIEAMP